MTYNELIGRKGVVAWIAGATALILFIPFVAMQVTDEVAWTAIDFAAMGFLLFGAVSFYVLVCRSFASKFRPLLALTIVAMVLYVWAELAVGVFLPIGS